MKRLAPLVIVLLAAVSPPTVAAPEGPNRFAVKACGEVLDAAIVFEVDDGFTPAGSPVGSRFSLRAGGATLAARCTFDAMTCAAVSLSPTVCLSGYLTSSQVLEVRKVTKLPAAIVERFGLTLPPE